MKSRVSTDGAPKADHILSQGIVANGTIYVSGRFTAGQTAVLL